MVVSARKVVLYVIGSVAGAVLSEGVSAHEPGDFSQWFRGVTISDPLGAAPPPGVYFENTTLYAPEAFGHGQVSAYNVSASAEIPLLLWSTGWKFLNASVIMAISKQYFEVNAWRSAAVGPPFASTHYPAW